MTWSWRYSFRGLLHRSPQGPAQTRLLIKRLNECTAGTRGSRGSRRASGRCPLGPQEMWTCLHSCFISEAGQDTRPTACLAPPLGDLGRDSPLTWSCFRAFWACSGFLYSTNPNPMDNSAPETDKSRESHQGAGWGGKRRSWDRPSSRAPGAPWASPQPSHFFMPLLVPRKTPAPRLPFITGRLEESANAVTEPPPEAWQTIN